MPLRHPWLAAVALPRCVCTSSSVDITACCSAAAGAAVEAILSAEADAAAAAASSNGVPKQPQEQEPEPAVKSAAASSGNSGSRPLDLAAVTMGKAHWLYLVHPEVPQAGQTATVLFNRSVSDVLRWGATPAISGASFPPLPSLSHHSHLFQSCNTKSHIGQHSPHTCLLMCG